MTPARSDESSCTLARTSEVTTTLTPSYLAYVSMVARTLGSRPEETTTELRFLTDATHMRIASAAAVGPSYIEALEQSMPVRRQIIVCHSNM